MGVPPEPVLESLHIQKWGLEKEGGRLFFVAGRGERGGEGRGVE
jgi:hypothetical protein